MKNCYYKLEYDKILIKLASYCKTYVGQDLANKLLPSNSEQEVIRNLKQTTQALSLIHRIGNLPIDTLPNRYQGCLKVLTPQMIDGPAGVSALRAFIEKESLDMLCIDQHSLLEDDRHGRSPVEKASNISRDLKNLQVLKKIPIIAVSQQNRESTDNGVNTQHIAQSDRIAQDSTIIIFFEQKDGIMTMHLVKSRDSANMKNISYACDLDKGLWQYIPEDGNALSGAGSEELKKEFYEDEEEVF